ncbi:hypothetical protein ACFQT0_09670 [Hymenobacter humi]|uniref:Uncharacterized protein n=1 Tax=Hymenobacter humi TaxID=1411620 RepID=A0ABW2U5M1_9BACT
MRATGRSAEPAKPAGQNGEHQRPHVAQGQQQPQLPQPRPARAVFGRHDNAVVVRRRPGPVGQPHRFELAAAGQLGGRAGHHPSQQGAVGGLVDVVGAAVAQGALRVVHADLLAGQQQQVAAVQAAQPGRFRACGCAPAGGRPAWRCWPGGARSAGPVNWR